MAPRERALRLYGAPSGQDRLAWPWVEKQLEAAGTYWLVARAPGHSHPRPVWGLWHGQRLHLSVGSPALRRAIGEDPSVTVHLDSGTDVVLLEGTAAPTAPGGTPSPVIELNRAAAVAMAEGCEAGLKLVDELEQRGELRGYYLLAAARADMLRRLDRWGLAVQAYKEAIALAGQGAERRFLARRLAEAELMLG